MIPAVEALGGEIVECAVLVDRSGGRATLTSPTTGRTYPLRSLWQLDLPTYEAGRGHLPAVRRRRARCTPRAAPAPPAPAARRLTRMDRRTRNLFAVRPRRRRRGHRRRGAPAESTRMLDPDGPPDTTQVEGVVVAVDCAGLTDVRGFTLRDGRRDASSSASASSRTATEFPPGHLAEHQATAQPVRCVLPDGRRALRRPPRGRRAELIRPPGYSTAATAASSSSSLKISMNDAGHDAVSGRPTKTHGSASRPHSSVAGAGRAAGRLAVRTGWSWPRRPRAGTARR